MQTDSPSADEARRALAIAIDPWAFTDKSADPEDRRERQEMALAAADRVAAFRDQPERAGEAMRKRCLKAVRSGLIEAPYEWEDDLCGRIEDAIRALPLMDDEGGGA